MSRAFIFPGQGSQSVGMGLALYEAFAAAREVFEEVDEALQENLSDLIFRGDEQTLTLTRNAQPALMAVSMAVVRVLESQGGIKLGEKVAFVAGHSLGEYSALAAAGAFSLSDTAKVLRQRGQAMQAAVGVGEGAMAALLGPDIALAEEIAELASDETGDEARGNAGVCVCANDNAPGQVVVSGAKKAVEKAMEIAREKGCKRAVLLPVSAPFHSPLMQSAARVMAEVLANTQIVAPVVPLIANVSAQVVSAPEKIRQLLVEQVTARVRWRESVLTMKEQGVHELVELGAGKVLCGLARRIDRELTAVPVGNPEDIEAFLKTL